MNFRGRVITWVASVALISAAVLIAQPILSVSAAAGDCTLDVPPNPLSAKGLATPYLLRGQDCHEAVSTTSAFAEATILNPETGDIFTYKPLVIDAGTSPVVKPTLPQLPDDAVVGIVFGFNGNNLTLRDVDGSLSSGHCVNGLPGSIFGQVSYCNSIEFYTAANTAVHRGLTHVPQRKKALDGEICPTPWSFSIVDQDPVDNTDTTYLVTPTGGLMQNTVGNKAAFPTAHLLGNPSDFRLTQHFVDAALKCNPWTVRDLTDPNKSALSPSQHTDSLQARFTRAQGNDANTADQDEGSTLRQSEVQNGDEENDYRNDEDRRDDDISLRVALVPLGDPMTLVDGQPSLAKTNLYRRNVDQPVARTAAGASTRRYCQGMLTIGLPRVALDRPLTQAAASPDPAAANSLFTFLASRFNAAFGPTLLNCTGLLNVVNPVTLTVNGAGVVVDAQINLHPGRPSQQAPTFRLAPRPGTTPVPARA